MKITELVDRFAKIVHNTPVMVAPCGEVCVSPDRGLYSFVSVAAGELGIIDEDTVWRGLTSRRNRASGPLTPAQVTACARARVFNTLLMRRLTIVPFPKGRS